MNDPINEFDIVDFIEGKITAAAAKRLIVEGIKSKLSRAPGQVPPHNREEQVRRIVKAASKLVNPNAAAELARIYDISPEEIPDRSAPKWSMEHFLKSEHRQPRF